MIGAPCAYQRQAKKCESNAASLEEISRENGGGERRKYEEEISSAKKIGGGQRGGEGKNKTAGLAARSIS